MPVAVLFLKAIISQINQYVHSVSDDEPTVDLVVLGNIATSIQVGGDNLGLNDRIVVSLVNVDEEGSLKNKGITIQRGQQHINYSPPVYINLYLLFAANFSEYDASISSLFRIIEFFQGKKLFKFKNTPSRVTDESDLQKLNDLEINFDLHTLNFEQLNNLWGSLGGKQMPFVLYRARLVPVFMEQPLGRTGSITEIDLESIHLPLNQ